MFQLHPNLEKKIFVTDLPLSRILLEDNKFFPWIFLIPKRKDVVEITDLSLKDQYSLIEEINTAQNVMRSLFSPDRINIAAIGNKTPQLHVHVIARFNKDPAWPGTVWDCPFTENYAYQEKENIIKSLKETFCSIQ